MAGTESVLPRWAHHRFPEAERFIHKVRSTPCGQGCSWCAENHDLTKQLKEIFKFHLFPSDPPPHPAATASRSSWLRG